MQINALGKPQKAQTREIRTRLEEIEWSFQDDNGRRPGRHVRDEHEIDFERESKHGEDHMDHGRGQDPEGWIMKSIKIDVSAFDGWMDPHVFSYSLSIMNHYFKWYETSEERKVKLATMTLLSQARTFWINLEHHEQWLRLSGINTWERMKERLKDKYLH